MCWSAVHLHTSLVENLGHVLFDIGHSYYRQYCSLVTGVDCLLDIRNWNQYLAIALVIYLDVQSQSFFHENVRMIFVSVWILLLINICPLERKLASMIA